MVLYCASQPITSNNNYKAYAADPTGCCGLRPIRLLTRYLCWLIVMFEPVFWASDFSLYRPIVSVTLHARGYFYSMYSNQLELVPW